MLLFESCNGIKTWRHITVTEEEAISNHAGAVSDASKVRSSVLDDFAVVMAEAVQPVHLDLIVTNRGLEPVRYLRFALRRAVPGARVRGAGFRGILGMEAEGDPREIARLVYEECSQNVGHLTVVLATVDSREESIREAAVRIGAAEIGSEESFSFRLNKRGVHGLQKDTSTLEREIGGTIWTALERKYNKKPKVDLKNPDIAVIAEILGPIAAIGISRREWREQFQTSS